MPETESVAIKPLFARVLIERTIKEKTQGGVIIPENSLIKETMHGRVLETGPTAEGVCKGDYVYFGKHAGTKIRPNPNDENEEYFLCQDEDILCVIEGV